MPLMDTPGASAGSKNREASIHPITLCLPDLQAVRLSSSTLLAYDRTTESFLQKILETFMYYSFDAAVKILGNNKLCTPQIETYIKAQEHSSLIPKEDALIVLPTRDQHPPGKIFNQRQY